jgi:hypothetical protein
LPLEAGDAVAIRHETEVEIEAIEASEVVSFDLA